MRGEQGRGKKRPGGKEGGGKNYPRRDKEGRGFFDVRSPRATDPLRRKRELGEGNSARRKGRSILRKKKPAS